MFKWVGKTWAKFAAYNRERMVPSVLSYDEEDHKRNFAFHFDSAKRLSDFIGMIVRVSFAIFACAYFYEKARADDGLLSYVYGFCCISSLGVALAMGRMISSIIFLYEVRELPKMTGKIGKRIIFCSAIITTFVIYLGAFQLVRDVAAQAALAPTASSSAATPTASGGQADQ